MSPRLYLLLGLAILAFSLVRNVVDDQGIQLVLSWIPILTGFMAIGHAIQRVCVSDSAT